MDSRNQGRGRLSEAPEGLSRRDIEARLERQLDAGGRLTLILQDVPEGFEQCGNSWAIRLSEPEQGSVLLETRGIRYRGDDHLFQRLFDPERLQADGFLTIALMERQSPEEVLARSWEVLGWRTDVESEEDNAVTGSPDDTARHGSAGQATRTETPPEASGQEPHQGAPSPEPATGIRDLVEEARHGRLRVPIGRDAEIDECIRILTKRGKAAAVLVGEAGVGKTAIVEGLAYRIAEGEVPETLRDTELVDVNLGILAAGASRVNEFEGRVAQILDRARDNPGLILFLDEMHLLRDARSDASQMMKADLGRGRIRCLGATTTGEYRAIEEDPALQRRFQKIPVLEPAPEVIERIVQDTALRLEGHHGVSVPGQLVGTTIELARRFVRERRLPDSALDLLDEACASASLEAARRASRDPSAPVTLEEAHLLGVVSSWTRTPVEQLGVAPSDPERLRALEALLKEELLEQDGAIEAVIRHLKREALRPAGLSPQRQRRPRGSFLLHGTSGVGKSSLPQILAPALCGAGSLIRIDCSTLDQEHSLARLVGSPPGYIGHGKGGELTNALRSRAFGVLLFDEIEKAHPDFSEKILIPALGEGSVTDMNTGQSLDLSGYLVFATTNACSGDLLDRTVGFSGPGDRTPDRSLGLRRVFSNAVLGRFDAILGFRPLSLTAARLLVERHLAELEESLAGRYPGLDLHVTEPAMDRLLRGLQGELERQGARAVRRAFRVEVEDPILEYLMARGAASIDELQLSTVGVVERIQDSGGAPKLLPPPTALVPNERPADTHEDS